MNDMKRYKLIACEIMFREVCLCVSQCRNIVDIVFMPKGLHDIGDKKMSERLQQEIEQTDSDKYQAILLCYGLCNNGVRGLHSTIPIIMPRAHDCITLLLGSREVYKAYFDNNPGTYFKSPGWIERDANPNDMEDNVMGQLGLNKTYEEYVELYGEENADFISEILGNWQNNYTKLAYIDTKTGDTNTYREIARKQAHEQQWEYEEIQGNTRLIAKLVNGEWNEEEFLTIQAGHAIEPAEVMVC